MNLFEINHQSINQSIPGRALNIDDRPLLAADRPLRLVRDYLVEQGRLTAAAAGSCISPPLLALLLVVSRLGVK